MVFCVIAEIVDAKLNVIGLRAINMDMLLKGRVQVGNYEKGKLLGNTTGVKVEYCTNGKSNYPKIDTSNNLVKDGGLTVLRKKGSDIIISNWKGHMIKGSVSDAIPALKQYGIANGFIRNNSDIVLYKGKEEEVKSVEAVEKNVKVEEVKKPIKNIGNNNDSKTKNLRRLKSASSDCRRVRINGGLNGNKMSSSIMCDVNGVQMTLEQKIVKAQLELQNVAPFISSMVATTNIVESTEIKTAGVAIDTMYFNPNYLKDLSVNHIKFILMHEMSHLLMQHRMREEDRDHKKWNVACDAYINKMCATDFPNIFSLQEMREAGYVVIEDLDLETDIPEKIYGELKEEQGKTGKPNSNGNGNGSPSGSTGNSGDGDGDENGNGKGNKNQNKQDGQDGNGNGSDGNNEESSEASGGSVNGQGEDNTEYSCRGKKVTNSKDNIKNDMIDDSKTESMSNDTMKQRSKAIVERAKVYMETQGSKSRGTGEGNLAREVERVMAPKVDWLPLVRNRLTKASQRIMSFSAPDKRFLSRNMILPGPKNMLNDSLENVILAIDTSGSISTQELSVFLAQFKQLMNKFKIDGEVLYWGTNIEAVYPFKNWNDILKSKPKGGGGTDINCVFKYLEGRDFKIGKKKKPSMIVVATDGYFGDVDKKYKKWSNEVIWVISPDCYENFKEPFGKKAAMKEVETE